MTEIDGTEEYSLIEDISSVKIEEEYKDTQIEESRFECSLQEQSTIKLDKVNLAIHNKIVRLRRKILSKHYWPDEVENWNLEYYWKLQKLWRYIKSGKAPMPTWIW